MLEERLREQKERHDGGNPMDRHWRHLAIRSRRREPERPLIRRNRRRRWSRRDRLRRRPASPQTDTEADVVLDIRQIELALRRLRAFTYEGRAEGLETSKAPSMRPRKNGGRARSEDAPAAQPATRVILMMDVRGIDGSLCHHDEPALQRGEARDPLS